MSLHLENKQLNLFFNNKKYYLITKKINKLIPNNTLCSLDKYYLKDENNIYLVCLEDNFITQQLLTKNNEIIKTIDNEKLLIRQGE